MDGNPDSLSQYRRKVGEILLQEWDPLGVNEIPEAADEYDSYIHGVLSLLTRRVSRQTLIDHLVEIEILAMCSVGNRQRAEATVDRLVALREAYEPFR